MFGRLTNVRIKSAEDAMEAGRLEDAFEIATAEDLAGNRKIQSICKELAEAFLKRGQDLLLSKRFEQALADFDRAEKCGQLKKKVREWQDRGREAMQADRRAEANRAANLAEARHRFHAGSLAGAAEVLEDAPVGDSEHAALSDAIERQADRAERAFESAKAALKADNLPLAVQRFEQARALHTKLQGLAAFETKLVQQVLTTARDSFKQGRLDRVQQELNILGGVGEGHPEREELEDAYRLASEAAEALHADRYARAGVLLGRLAQVSPKAGWISDARKNLRLLEDNRRVLLEGPLGLIAGDELPSAYQAETEPVGDETLPLNAVTPPPRPSAKPPVVDDKNENKVIGKLPRRILLRIDGAGSFLLLRGDRIGIGRSGPNSTADLPLISDLSEREAEVVRAGEDYFIVSQAGVELAGQPVDHALLQNGDRIRLGRRIRLKFARPSLKSSAAVLDLEGVRTTTDCRRVILWSGPVLMGGTRECHLRLGSGIGEFVLMERGDRIYVKRMGPGGTATPVILGEQTEIGELRLSATDWSDESAPGNVIG